MSTEFKAGDLVYCPHLGTNIYLVSEQSSSPFPLRISGESYEFTNKGFHKQDSTLPSVYKATEANCKALCTLYSTYYVSPREHLVELLRQHFKHHRNKVVIKTNGEYFIVSAITSDAVVGPHSLSQFLNYVQPYSYDTPFLILGN